MKNLTNISFFVILLSIIVSCGNKHKTDNLIAKSVELYKKLDVETSLTKQDFGDIGFKIDTIWDTDEKRIYNGVAQIFEDEKGLIEIVTHDYTGNGNKYAQVIGDYAKFTIELNEVDKDNPDHAHEAIQKPFGEALKSMGYEYDSEQSISSLIKDGIQANYYFNEKENLFATISPIKDSYGTVSGYYIVKYILNMK